MGSNKSFYKVFFNEHEHSLGLTELVSANSRFLSHCDKFNILEDGVFAEIIELKHSLCQLNVYYSNEQDELDQDEKILSALLESEAIPSLFKVRHLMIAEYIIPGQISREHWKERSDVAGLIKHRKAPPAAERAEFLISSSLYDGKELLTLQREVSHNSILDSFRSYFPGQSSSSSRGNSLGA